MIHQVFALVKKKTCASPRARISSHNRTSRNSLSRRKNGERTTATDTQAIRRLPFGICASIVERDRPTIQCDLHHAGNWDAALPISISRLSQLHLSNLDSSSCSNPSLGISEQDVEGSNS